MRSFSNKRKKLFILLVTAKPVMLLVLLFYITGLGGWRKNTTQAVSNVRLQKNTSFVEVEMTSKRSKTENRYHPLILQASNRYKVEPAIIKAIIRAESGFNPKAVSKVGAKGLMQLMPRTARSLGLEDSFKPAHNIDAGVRYFKHLLDQFDGDIELALAAYNAGSFNVRKYGGIPPFKETKFYINKVLKFYEVYRTT